MHFIVAVMTGISSVEAWLPQPRTHIETTSLPLLSTSLLLQIPVEQWRDEPFRSLMSRGKVPKERGRQNSWKGHFLLFLEKVAVQLICYAAKENWSLGPHIVSLYKNCNCNFTTKVSINKERQCGSGGLPHHPQQHPERNNSYDSICI